MNTKKSKPKTEATKKHHKAILKAMREVIAAETYKTTLGDDRMAEAVCEKGIYASHGMVRDVRLENNIPSAYERKMDHFARAKAKAK